VRPTRAQLEQLSPADLDRLAERLEAMAQERESGKVPWLCPLADCDGRPHKGRPGVHARADQRPPHDDEWDVIMWLAGRGWGKTRTGAEWAISQARNLERGALVGPTAADTRDILVEGESGILACAPASFRPVYEPSKRRLTYPNGSIQMCYSADEPDRLRGPQHHYGWFDELASWRRLQYAWDMAQLGMRLGDHPRIAITTTPRPLPLVKELLKDEMCRTVRGSTYDNLHNLAPTFRRAVVSKYEGTTLGRQELNAEVLDDLPGALLSRAVIDAARVETEPEWRLRIVAMDPAGTGLGDETGLIAGGRGTDGDDYVTHDWSDKLTPQAAAVRAWDLFDHVRADVLVYEDNFGKGWVSEVLTKVWRERNPELHTQGVACPLAEIHASHGKQLRAQPVVMRYEQGRVHHVGDPADLAQLEDQYTTWIPEETPSKSPDRVDAGVHLVSYLMKRFDRAQSQIVSPHGRATKGARVHPLYAAREAKRRRELERGA